MASPGVGRRLLRCGQSSIWRGRMSLPQTQIHACHFRPHTGQVLLLEGHRICLRDSIGHHQLASIRSFTTFSTSPPTLKDPYVAARNLHANYRRQRGISGAGAEPGLDPFISNPRWDYLNHLPQVNSDIKVVDYSSHQIIERDIKSSAFETFCKDEPKPSWATSRWIYVNGINWHVVRNLGRTYKLHPLAIEDVMDTRSPTKVDWYSNHCFLEMNMARLTHIQDDEPIDMSDPAAVLRRRHGDHKWRLLSLGRFGMSIEQVSMFLTEDGTVITIFDKSGQEVLTPILTRLHSPSTIIRSSNDPSMLFQAVIDVVVDLALPIGRAVGDTFDDIELAVLTTPKIDQSKRLHILRSGLTVLSEHITAVESLIRTLGDHRAVLNFHSTETKPSSNPTDPRTQIPTSVQISPLAQIYLQDVRDHASGLSRSTSMAIRSAEHLTSLIFNSIAANQNDSVRKLTLVSSFFLPLTFLTGYFGMNFDPMPIVNEHSDVYFWYIAVPVMGATLLIMSTRVGSWFGRGAWRRRRFGREGKVRAAKKTP